MPGIILSIDSFLLNLTTFEKFDLNSELFIFSGRLRWSNGQQRWLCLGPVWSC